MLTAMAERAPLERLIGGLALAAVASQLVSLAAGLPPLGATFLVDAFFASAMAGAALIAAVALPRRWRAPALAAGLVLELVLIVAFPRPPDFTQWVVQRGTGLGVALLAALAVHARRSKDSALALRCAGVLPLFVAASGPLLDLTALAHPLTLDGPCLIFDQHLGQPSFAAGMLFWRAPVLGQLCAVIYGELPLFCALALVLDRARSVRILTTFVIIGVTGYVLYHLFPVAGPRFAFSGWPGRVPALTESLHHAGAAPPVPRNCMPSLHTAWVIYCGLQMRGGWRALSSLWVAGTLLATLGLGLHYAIDLIAALPFLAAVLWGIKRWS
jgi:PAP2 superfamily